MRPIEPPDTHYLSAAIGWLGLGDLMEAARELACISAEQQTQPDVLEVRWQLYAQRQQWHHALQVAKTLVTSAPQRSSGWLHQAYALRRVDSGGVKQAWKALLTAYEKFPKEAIISYNLSCYACQMQ